MPAQPRVDGDWSAEEECIGEMARCLRELGAATGAEVNGLRTYRSFFAPVAIASAFGALLGTVAGVTEARQCVSHLGPLGLILGIWALFLIGVLVAIGGLLTFGMGWWRKDKGTIQTGLGMVLAWVALPATYFVVTATLRVAGCGNMFG
jgi:hypothetical protein